MNYRFSHELSIFGKSWEITRNDHGKCYHLVMTNIAMERSTIFKNGKPSISMGHLYRGYVSHNQRLKGTSTGNHRFSHDLWRFPVKKFFPCYQWTHPENPWIRPRLRWPVQISPNSWATRNPGQIWIQEEIIYPLVNIQKAMENHHFSWENPLFLWPCSMAKC